MESLIVLGQQAPEMGEILERSLAEAAVCLSAGSDPESPSLLFKGDKVNPSKPLPGRLEELTLWLSSEKLLTDEKGGSTLLLAGFDESNRNVFGLSLGDCSLCTLGQHGLQMRNCIGHTFV